MTLAIHHARRTSGCATQFIGRFQTAPRLIGQNHETTYHSASIALLKVLLLQFCFYGLVFWFGGGQKLEGARTRVFYPSLNGCELRR